MPKDCWFWMIHPIDEHLLIDPSTSSGIFTSLHCFTKCLSSILQHRPLVRRNNRLHFFQSVLTCCQPAVSHSPWSAEAFFQCSLNERFLYSAFCEALCSVHAVAKAICSDALKIHLASQMISVNFRLSARHSLRHVAPVRVSIHQNLLATVFTSIGFQNLRWHREVVTLPNERLDSQHDEGQFSECHLKAAKRYLLCLSVFDIIRHNAH